jgi:LysM repeat protein
MLSFRPGIKFSLPLLLCALLFDAPVFSQTSTKESPQTRIHIVKHDQSLKDVSKKYHTTPEAILKLNPGLSEHEVTEGSRINVPIVTSEMRKEQRDQERLKKHAITYSVQKKETLNSIATKINTSVKNLITWNKLSSEKVKEGQELIVGFTKPKYVPREETKTSAASTPPAAPAKTMIRQSGAGSWIRDVDDAGNFYALHATAPVGSLITVTNTMNNKSITVKVIGKLPATAANDHVIIKLSASAARALHILDDKFRVDLSYAAK